MRCCPWGSMKNVIDKRRLALALCIVLGVLCVGVAYLVLWKFTGFGFPCIFYTATGIKCAGCGMTHAAAALLTLDFKEAFRHNAMFLPVIVYIAWYAISVLLRFVKKKAPALDVKPYAVHITVGACMLVYGIVRNLI